MHKLDRTGIPAPDCLSDYDYNTQTWDNFGGTCKEALRAALVQMQGIPGVTTRDAGEYGVRCAYCEGQIFHEGHIEHFRRKNLKHYPELTFDWHNLFLACGSKKHCGHYKDRPSAPAYNPEKLIKPDEHDPDEFFYFHSSGEIRIREKLSAENAFRASETIRVFGLDNPALEGERARAVSKYRQMSNENLEEIFSWSEADRREYFESEIEETRWHPYATTIKHFLQSQ